MQQARTPTLRGWLLRDITITVTLMLILWAALYWHGITGSAVAAAAGAILGFIAAYVLCYIHHEWGHLVGARLTRSEMPLNSYRGALIGRFDIKTHSVAQFLALSWGGVIAYTLTALTTVLLYGFGGLAWVGAGLAVGGLAFVSQSLCVDLPQIWKVMQGANAAETNARGATAQVILRRTWQSWLTLSAALLAWNLAV